MTLPTPRTISERPVQAYLADISAASSCYTVAPFRGQLVRAYSVLQGTISGADAVWTMKINGQAVTGVSVTVAQSGSAAGDVDSTDTIGPTGNSVNEGDTIEFVSNGASSTTCPAMFTAVIRPN